MTKEEYRQKINELTAKFVTDIHNPIVDLTKQFKKENPDLKFDDVFRDCGSIYQMAVTAAWIEDNLNGLSGSDMEKRNSRTYKVGKAFDYNY